MSITDDDVALSLRQTVEEIEAHCAILGWDRPPRLFALVNAQRALKTDPELASKLDPETVQKAAEDPNCLLAVLQDELNNELSLDEILATLSWGSEVDGCALVLERLTLPPSAEADLPVDPVERVAAAQKHPDKQEIRVACGVLRTGHTWSTLRLKAHDDPRQILGAENLTPTLAEALLATLEAVDTI